MAKSKLSCKSNKTEKNAARNEFAETGIVDTVLRVDQPSRMLCDAKDLHKIPHGQAKTNGMCQAKSFSGNENISFCHIDLHCKTNFTHDTHEASLKTRAVVSK